MEHVTKETVEQIFSKKEQCMKIWLSVWLYVITAIGSVLMTLVVQNYRTWDLYITLATLTSITLVLHVLEEWRFPGGFFYMYNKIMAGSQQYDRYPMSQVTDMLTNFIPIIFCVIMLTIGMPYVVALVWNCQ